MHSNNFTLTLIFLSLLHKHLLNYYLFMLKVFVALYFVINLKGIFFLMLISISFFFMCHMLSEILLQMSEQMPEMKRVISGNVVTKIIDNFQQISTQEVLY
jgi:hypothetical protein